MQARWWSGSVSGVWEGRRAKANKGGTEVGVYQRSNNHLKKEGLDQHQCTHARSGMGAPSAHLYLVTLIHGGAVSAA